MLRQWDVAQPGRVDNIARSLRHVVPSHLGDEQLFDFASLGIDDQSLAPLVEMVEVEMVNLVDITPGNPIREG
jgi:tRNA 2-thiocytidine biosynthesis protein TtcA